MFLGVSSKIYHFIVWIYLSTASSNEKVLPEQKVTIYSIIVVRMPKISSTSLFTFIPQPFCLLNILNINIRLSFILIGNIF